MGFFKKNSPDEDSYDGEEDDEDAGGALMESAQPGTFGIIPEDYTFEKWDPSHPNQSYGPFTKGVLRGIAAGLDVTYFTLAEDLEGVNYSSARIGQLGERDQWRALQQFMVEHFARAVYLRWLKSSMMTGALDIRMVDYKRLQEPLFQPRGWTWTDPKKEADATVVGINNGFDTITETLAEQGRDIEEYVATRKRELKLLKNAGIELNAAKPAPANTGDDEEETPPQSSKP
jgi:lambda family phage portal protein